MTKHVGDIVNTHGIKGEIRVLSNSDFKHIRFAPGSKLTAKMRNASEQIIVERRSVHKNFDIIKLVGYDNINDVLKFKGAKILGPILGEDVLADGEYFTSQIIGLNIIDQDGVNRGVIESINTDNYQKLLTVKTACGKKYIPYVEEFVKQVDLENNNMHINVIPGLLDEN